jgi:hypothetical protein
MRDGTKRGTRAAGGRHMMVADHVTEQVSNDLE